jgi:iron donor protein CyaY
MIDEQEFRNHADRALDRLNRALNDASEEHGFESDFNAGALTIEFEEPPARFVVSPNTPVRQVWLSALSKSYKLDWNPARNTFVLADTGQSLIELVGDRISEQLGTDVTLTK